MNAACLCIGVCIRKIGSMAGYGFAVIKDEKKKAVYPMNIRNKPP
jgi:hypothetical protein